MRTSDIILAFGSHPDDVEIFCAGTLSILKKKGYTIHITTMCGGEMGSSTLGKEEIRVLRLGESKRSAKILGAEYHWAGGEDIEVEFSHEFRVKTAKVIREIDPFLVFAPPPIDYMIDHEETSKLIRNACFCASMPNFNTGDIGLTERIPYLYYWDAVEGKDCLGRPTPIGFYVDISDEIDVKTKMLKAHKSQRDWLFKHHGIDQYIDSMKAWGKRRGKEIGVKYAECFSQHLGHPFPQDNILKEILGEAVLKGIIPR